MRYAKDATALVGEIDKSATEIVRVYRRRFNGQELVHIPVYSIGGNKAEKGIALNLDQWRVIIPMVIQALEIELPVSPGRRPAVKKVVAITKGSQQVSINPKPPAMAKPAKKKRPGNPGGLPDPRPE